jgi:hypothetical protein
MNTHKLHEADKRRLRFALSQLAILATAVLIPKCPLCIVAYLTAFGVSAAVASHLAPWVLPAVWGGLALATVYGGLRLVRRRRAGALAGSESTIHTGCCGG